MDNEEDYEARKVRNFWLELEKKTTPVKEKPRVLKHSQSVNVETPERNKGWKPPKAVTPVNVKERKVFFEGWAKGMEETQPTGHRRTLSLEEKEKSANVTPIKAHKPPTRLHATDVVKRPPAKIPQPVKVI